MKNKVLNTILILVLLVLVVFGGYKGFELIYKKPPEAATNSTGVTVYQVTTMTKTDIEIELEDIQAVLMSAKTTPYHRENEDEIIGFQISEIQPNSFWTKFGFRENDLLTHVNDIPMTSASSAMGMYTTLRSATKIDFKVVRNEQPGILELNIKSE